MKGKREVRGRRNGEERGAERRRVRANISSTVFCGKEEKKN